MQASEVPTETAVRVAEFCDWRAAGARVEAEAGLVRGVKILGLESRNGREYLLEALQRAASLYEGAKVNVNHGAAPVPAARDYRDRIGTIRNVAVRPGEGLFGDFQFNPKHALAEQLVWDAEHAPENVGFSHHVEARCAQRGGRTVVEEITRVFSVDLVADPATTRGLFESAGTALRLAEATADDVRRLRPDLVDGLVGQSAGELARLRESERQREREAAVRRLLVEFGLPLPESDDARARAIVAPRFQESLRSAPDEAAVRALVEDRARLVRVLESGGAGGMPQSRDPLAEERAAVSNLRSFVAAIT